MAFGVYVAMRSLYNVQKSETYVTANMLCYELTGNMNFTRNFKESIVAGVKELIEKRIVAENQAAAKNEWILDFSNLYIDFATDEGTEKEYYIPVELSEIRAVFKIHGRHDKFAMLRYFALLIGTLDCNIQTEKTYVNAAGAVVTETVKNFFGHMGTEYLALLIGTSKDVGIEYTRLLEDAKLIYVFRHQRLIWNGWGDVISFNNNYGRYKDASLIKKYALVYEKMCGIEITGISKKDTSHRNRSLAQKYNYFVKGKSYDIDTIKEIYEYVHEKNIELLKICSAANEEQQLQEYMEQLRDEECFKVYLDADGNFINISKE